MSPSGSKRPPKTETSPDKEERLAKALRDNLRKRKKKKSGGKASSSS